MENNFKRKVEYYNLTIPQENIWMVEQLNPNTNVNQIYGTLSIEKSLNLDIVRAAINRMIKNNDALRIRVTEKDTKPVQYIAEYEYEDLPVYFLEDSEQDKVKEIVRSIGLEHLNILNGKLYDFRIIYMPSRVCLCVKMHHLIADAWSMAQLFVEHFGLFYKEAENNILSSQKPSYLEYIFKNEQYRNSEKYLKDQQFWTNYISKIDCNPEFELPKNKTCVRLERNIDKELYNKLYEFCRENNISKYSFFLGIISIYFSKIFSKKDIVIGTPFLNRAKARKELDMMGMFVTTLPLHIRTGEVSNFVELCKQIGATNMSCFKHCKFPYTEIQNEYEKKTGNNTNLYEIVFSYQKNSLEEQFDKEIFKNTWYANNTQVYPIFVSYMNHFGENMLCYDYMVNLFEEKDINLMHERMTNIMKQVLKNKEMSIENISVLCEKDIEILQEFNNTGDFQSTNDTVISRFDKIVNKNKTKVAIKYNDIEITYKELNKKSNAIANSIIKRGIKKGSAVSIIFDRSPEMIITMLGIIKAGCYYIAILPEEEQSRAEFIVTNSESALLITEKKYFTQIGSEVIKNKVLFEEMLDGSEEQPQVAVKQTDIAYLIYTSGSTGTPKGVMIKHENIVSFIDTLNLKEDTKYIPEDIHLSLLKCSFDAFAYDIYATILNGAKLVVLPKQIELNPEAVVRLIEKEKVTKFLSVPTWVYEISNAAQMYKADISSLQFIGMGGEAVKPQKMEYLHKNFPNTAVYNVYGPTETTVFVIIHKINTSDVESKYSPIGTPIPCTRAVIMDYNSTEVLPVGATGELVIYEDDTSIHNITNGYLKLDDKTSQRYIKFRNPITKKIVKGYRTGDTARINENLEMDYLGRNDDFKKVNGGYLVSLEEVEKRIEKILGTAFDVAVVATPLRNTNTIILFISKKSESINISISDINEELENHLTFYMRPKKIVELEKFPYNNNGKVNKKLLTSMASEYIQNKEKAELPNNATEQKIYDVVKEIVNTDFSITDDFENDLGIDSLNMTILYSKLNNKNISIQDLYTYPTVKDLAYMLKKETVQEEQEVEDEKIEIQNAASQMNLETVFLTGSTGFVGSHILRELAENEETQKIYCIVRQRLNLSSQERFEKRIKEYFDDETVNKIKKKVTVINGDLRKENFGLEQSMYNRIFKKVNTIINAAANVKHIGKYSKFYTDNVETVNSLIKTCLQFDISLAHVSTLSLNGYASKHIKEIFTENTLNIHQTFNRNPYLISKYEAERSILRNISEKNLNAKIFRIGNIMPRISDGLFQTNYSENGFLLSMNEFKNLNIVTENLLNAKTYLTPVDECAKAICEILKQDFCNTIYHIESDKAIKLSSIINIFENREIDEKIVTDEVFEKKISSDYSMGATYIKTVLCTPANKYEKNTTLEVLNSIGFQWNKLSKEYFENLVNLILKIK